MANQPAIRSRNAWAATKGALIRNSAIAMLMVALVVACRRDAAVERRSECSASIAPATASNAPTRAAGCSAPPNGAASASSPRTSVTAASAGSRVRGSPAVMRLGCVTADVAWPRRVVSSDSDLAVHWHAWCRRSDSYGYLSHADATARSVHALWPGMISESQPRREDKSGLVIVRMETKPMSASSGPAARYGSQGALVIANSRRGPLPSAPPSIQAVRCVASTRR